MHRYLDEAYLEACRSCLEGTEISWSSRNGSEEEKQDEQTKERSDAHELGQPVDKVELQHEMVGKQTKIGTVSCGQPKKFAKEEI